MLVTVDDLLKLNAVLWPDCVLYDRQIEVIESTLSCAETYVPAANKMGKDFVCGFLAPACFLVCQAKGVTCRIVTTSVAEHHLKVLWGEIGRFLSTARYPLDLAINYQEVRRAEEAQSKNPLNYLVGRVSAKGEGLAGHHADFTMFIGDEASGLDDECYKMAQGWAKHMLFIGNCNNCVNFFRKSVDAGNLEAA